MKRLHALVDRLRRERALDARSDIFEIAVERREAAVALVGVTTLPEVADVLIVRAGALRGIAAIHDEIVRLPDPGLGSERFGIVRAALAPLYAQPALPAPQISQLVTGMRVAILSRAEAWLRVRGEDGYLGWVHDGYVRTADERCAEAWRDGDGGVPAVSLGVEIVDDRGALVARLPWGARVVRDGRRVRLPDGTGGRAAAGLLLDAALVPARFPAAPGAIVDTARRWLGAPYLWGGISFGGVDCSGLVQAVYGMHGIRLPRDSDLQARCGESVDVGDSLREVRPADVLFFAEQSRRVSHVAIALGGTRILHAALGNGGVAIDDLAGDAPLASRLRAALAGVRRLV